MPDSIKRMFDQRHEVAGWVLLAGIIWLVASGQSDAINWQMVALTVLCLVTLLGSSRYAGVELGPIKLGSAARRVDPGQANPSTPSPPNRTTDSPREP